MIVEDQASDNDKFVAYTSENANIAAGGVPPMPRHRHRDHHGQKAGLFTDGTTRRRCRGARATPT